jgi:hypothetical protein
LRRDLYTLADHSTGSGTVKKIRVYFRAKGSGGSTTVEQGKTYIKVGTTEYAGSASNLTTSYANYYTEYTTNPATSAAWTWAEIDALIAGVGLSGGRYYVAGYWADGGKSGPYWVPAVEYFYPAYCTQVWVEVYHPDTWAQGGGSGSSTRRARDLRRRERQVRRRVLRLFGVATVPCRNGRRGGEGRRGRKGQPHQRYRPH